MTEARIYKDMITPISGVEEALLFKPTSTEMLVLINHASHHNQWNSHLLTGSCGCCSSSQGVGRRDFFEKESMIQGDGMTLVQCKNFILSSQLCGWGPLAYIKAATAPFPAVTPMQEHHKLMALCLTNCCSRPPQREQRNLSICVINTYFAYCYFSIAHWLKNPILWFNLS